MSSDTSLVPSRAPDVNRLFQCTFLGGNNNKWWRIELWASEGICRRTFGRVGDTCSKPQIDLGADLRFVNSKVREKTTATKPDKRYTEVVQATKPVDGIAGVKIDPDVEPIIKEIAREAGDNIAGYLNVSVDALSLTQIEIGRSTLKEIVERKAKNASIDELIALAQKYYTAIPTKLDRKIKPESAAVALASAPDVQEERLDQLVAAIESAQSEKSGGSIFDILGAELTLVTGPEYEQIAQMIVSTARHAGYIRIRVPKVYSVRIRGEREAYEANTFGKGLVKTLFHGTAAKNVRHILRGGLIVPTYHSNGRAFGNGIYFADVSSKSINYSVRSVYPRWLFVADVAIGNYLVAEDTYSWNGPPAPYESVWAQEGRRGGMSLSYSEYIVYNRPQQTIKYLAEVTL